MGLDLETRPAFDGVKKGVMVKGLHKGSKAEVGGDESVDASVDASVVTLLLIHRASSRLETCW
jgi:hypothetical protein